MRRAWNRPVGRREFLRASGAVAPIGLLLKTPSGKGKLKLSHLKDWTVVVPEAAILSEKYAADEFRSFFKQATGYSLPEAGRSAASTGNVFIGPAAVEGSGLSGPGVEDLGEEGFHIRVTPENIWITGGRPRGTLYGVYEFLERYLGIRFLTPDHTHVPDCRGEEIPCQELTHLPRFSYRAIWGPGGPHEFKARLRLNARWADVEKLGGLTQQRLIGHSFSHQLPVEQYGREHPEYFALVEGERKLEVWADTPQLCVTHPDVVEIVARSVIDELNQNPELRNVSVAQNDNDAYCRCDACEAINQREGTPMGSNLAFVNAVAERVERTHPHVKIGTLAYWYTRKPPRTIRPRHNVQIQLCSIECCTLHALSDPTCSKNRSFDRDLQGWAGISDDIWIWNYDSNFHFYDLPFPILRSIGPNLDYFRQNHVKGLFMQAHGQAGGLAQLRNYVIARCVWNPGMDSWELTQEFCRLHYGKAAETVLEYLTFLHENAHQTGLHPTCFPHPQELGLTPQVAGKIFDYFQRALAEAEDETVRNRVEKASICAYRAVLETCGDYKVENGLRKVHYPRRYPDLVQRYMTLTRKHGQRNSEERYPMDHYYKMLQRHTEHGVPVECLENETWRLMVVPEENAKMVELFFKPTGRHLLLSPQYRCMRKQFEFLVHEELGEKGYRHREPGVFRARNRGSSLELTKELSDGSTVLRRIRLDEKAPKKLFLETVLTHRGEDSRVYQLRVRPDFNANLLTRDSDVLGAYVKNPGWVQFNQDWRVDTGPNRALLEESQGGGFAFFNHRIGFGVMEEFDPEVFERLVFRWTAVERGSSANRTQVTLELVTPAVELKPGESFSFAYQISYLERPPDD